MPAIRGTEYVNGERAGIAGLVKFAGKGRGSGIISISGGRSVAARKTGFLGYLVKADSRRTH